MNTILHYRSLDSSKLEYERLARSGRDTDRWMVRADIQTAGVGRGKNRWHSPEGGLWLSFDLHYPQPVASFPLYVGFCLHRLLIKLFGLAELTLKWPNDIYLKDGKLAGILCAYQETPGRYQIALGLNTNPARDKVLLELKATILSEYIGIEVSNSYLADILRHAVEQDSPLLAKPASYLDYCRKRLYGLGREAEVEMAGRMIRGRIAGLTEDGFLALETSKGEAVTVTHGSLQIF